MVQHVQVILKHLRIHINVLTMFRKDNSVDNNVILIHNVLVIVRVMVILVHVIVHVIIKIFVVVTVDVIV